MRPSKEQKQANPLTSSFTGEKTILDFIPKNQPFIKNIEPWHYLKGAGAAGKDRAVTYRRDPMELKLKNPHGYQQLEPRRNGLEYINEQASSGRRKGRRWRH